MKVGSATWDGFAIRVGFTSKQNAGQPMLSKRSNKGERTKGI